LKLALQCKALKLVRILRDYLFNQELKLGVEVMKATGRYPNRRPRA